MAGFNNDAMLMAAAQMLQASGPSRQPQGLGAILGGGMATYMGAAEQARQRKMEEEQARQVAEMRALQMQEIQGSLQDAERARSAPKMPKFSTEVRVGRDADGKTFSYLTAEDGSIKRLDGVLPRDELKLANLGGKDVAYDPYALTQGQEFVRTPTADTAARLNFDQKKFNYEQQRDLRTDGISAQKAVGAPAALAASGKETPAATRVREARDVLDILDMAAPLLEKSTGSYLGAAGDQVARAFGRSTEGAQAAAELKVLQGALVSKMPKMTGPQSDKDVQLYREMAGQIGDSTLPVAQRSAAMKTIRTLNEKYANEGGASADWNPARPAPAARPSPATAKVATMSDIAETARKSGRSTAEVTAALRAKGYTIGGK